MKKLIAAMFAAFVLAVTPARAQLLGQTSLYRPAFARHRVLLAQADVAAPAPAPAPSQDPLALAAAAVAAIPPGKWAGKLDLTPDFALGAWQSLNSTDQAIGVSKRLWHLDKGGQTLLNVGIFAGAQKPIFTAAGTTPRFLGGATVAVPGSTLDWALGTKWGDQWAPRLKTGVLIAYDLTRIKQLKAVPDFVGLGGSYFFGGN